MLIRAGYFGVACGEAVGVIETACAKHAESQADIEMEIDGQRFGVTDAAWDDRDRILTATMWRIRERNLPSVLKDGQTHKVGDPLGEPASFAYIPSRSEALIQYNHAGPRHGLVRQFLERIGIGGAITVVPLLEKDAMARMKQAALVRRIEFTLGDVVDEAALRSHDAVGAAIDAMKDVHGTQIKVEISLGHTKGGLDAKAKKILESLASMATGVKAVKAGIKETEEHAVKMLDLIGGRLFVDMNVAESGRELDRNECRSRLRLALRDRQITSEEEANNARAEDPAAAPNQQGEGQEVAA